MLTPGKNSPAQDLHETPPCIAKRLVTHLNPKGRVLEPCKASGAFYKAFPDDCENFWCEISEGRDFFEFKEKVDWIITNPPFSVFFDFLRHSVSIANNIAFYCTINHAIALRARNRFMRQSGFGVVRIITTDTPPLPWPQSGFQVGLVHWQRGYKGTQENGHLEHKFPPAVKAPKRLKAGFAINPDQDLERLHQSTQANGIAEIFMSQKPDIEGFLGEIQTPDTL